MKKDSELYKKIKVHCYIVGLIAFLSELIVGVFLLHNLEKDEKTTGKYMAQITEKRVRARLDQYSMLSALLGNYISAGENLDENTFSELALLQTFIRKREMRGLLDWICCRNMNGKRMQFWQGIAGNIRLEDHTS